MPFSAELRLPDFTFFMRACYKKRQFKSMLSPARSGSTLKKQTYTKEL